MRKKVNINFVILVVLALTSITGCKESEDVKKRPNILFAISDDQSYPHTSFAGSKFVNTPAFDRVAREGIYFTNCYASSPGCAPSRGSIVTGRHHWQNEQSGQHASSWMKKYVPFVDELKANGYAVGRTSKGVSPFQYARDENDSLWRKEDAAGPAYDQYRYDDENDVRTAKGILNLNYAENFKYFMENIRGDRPFFFWYGGKEPHRKYEKGSWKRNGKKLEDVDVPAFMPDNEVIRGDLLDYAIEIEWFDTHLQKMLAYLEEIGELDNTIVIVTSDNGMPFPRAKANCYDYGIHVPFAIRYPKAIKPNQIVDELVSFVDFAPTILEVTKTESINMMPITGESMWNNLVSGHFDKSKAVFSGRERHSSSRYQNMGYPSRSVRKGKYLLIWNVLNDRWPAGAPQAIDAVTGELEVIFGLVENEKEVAKNVFTDIGLSPTKQFMVKHRLHSNVEEMFYLACDKRPEFELFDISKDMDCINNLSGLEDYKSLEDELKSILFQELDKTGDYRMDKEHFGRFDTYERYSPMRSFPEPVANQRLSDINK